jgi:DNA polymerase-3 subunit delta'
MFPDFFGNHEAAAALFALTRQERIPQTILLDGPEGIGKATLARRFAAALLGRADRIEQDDLSLPANLAIVAEREKWTADKRNDDPLLFATQSDFVTFAPDGPLRQISIQQMRLLKDQARLNPLHGNRRVFLIDHIDRANEQAANSLLKTLEEPPAHLILFLTAENPYDLLPTIRSRSVSFHLAPLSGEEMEDFARARGLTDPRRRIALADGSPGLAVSLDLEAYDQRRGSMLKLLEVASGRAPFSEWLKDAESIAARRDKLDAYLTVLYVLLEDLLLASGCPDRIRNRDLADRLANLAGAVSFEWLDAALRRVDDLSGLVRRNIQKSIAFDAFAMELRQLS